MSRQALKGPALIESRHWTKLTYWRGEPLSGRVPVAKVPLLITGIS